MDRRTFLIASALAAAGFRTSRIATAAVHKPFAPSPADGWRMFEVTTRVEPNAKHGAPQVWLPLPSVENDTWIKPMGNHWQGNAASVQELRDPVYGARILAARWNSIEPAPVLEVVSRFATRDRAIDLRKTALEITRGARTDLDKARAIYEWVVVNTQRNTKTRGCGLGDIRFMLETGDLSGKCADLNALYVGLARAVDLPARDVYGVRVADSHFGHKCLGKSGDISKAQHCRAEVWLEGFGWVPVDPADVRKVVLEEGHGLTLQDKLVSAVRRKLFGTWEMNWLAYNFAHDLKLPGSIGAPIPYLMYPQGENATGRFDSLDPSTFIYKLSSKEITA